MKSKTFKNFHLFLTLVLLCFIYALFLAHPITLVTADLGRHLKNGEFFLNNLKPIETNFYSYTQPNYSAINHHWLSGVIFQLIYRITGFTGLHFSFIILSVFTLAVFLKIALKKTNLLILVSIILLVVPLLAQRREIRPEVFSYLFSGIFLYLLLLYQQTRQKKFLYPLPFLQLFWVNLHIYFFVGLGLMGLAIFSLIIKEMSKIRKLKIDPFLTLILILSAIVCLINPFGVKGALAPLTIFDDYGYRLVENQPVWFIEKLIKNPNFIIFKIAFIITTISYALLFLKKKTIDPFFLLVFSLTGLAGWLAIRNFTLFGLFLIPILSQNLTLLLSKETKKGFRKLKWLATLVIFLFLPLVVFNALQKEFFGIPELGFGVYRQDNASMAFVKENNLKGPIFNNYDIGGYLIFHLFPQEKVFVDNRPEAYSVSFFKDLYIPIQEEEEKWQKALKRYQFNLIIFSHHDATPWGQTFLIARAKDEDWIPVFVDERVIIFLKNNQENQETIEQHQLGKDKFRILKN